MPSKRSSTAPRPRRERCADCASSRKRNDEPAAAERAEETLSIDHKRSSKTEVADLIRARYSLIWITSPEEERVEDSLKKLCVERETRLEVWSITEGFKTLVNGQGTRDVKDPMKAIDHVMRS